MKDKAYTFTLFLSIIFIFMLIPSRAFVQEKTGPTPPPERELPARYYKELADVYIKYRVTDKAVEMLKIAIDKEKNPQRKEEYAHQLGELYLKMNDRKAAIPYLEQAISLSEKKEQKCIYYKSLAMAYENIDEFEKAENAYKFIMANSQRDVEKAIAKRRLYQVYEKSGKLTGIIDELKEKVDRNPEDKNSLDTLVYIYNTITGERAKAIPFLELLKKIEPENKKHLEQLAAAYRLSKQYDKAIQTYIEMIELTPAERQIYLYISVFHTNLEAGNIDEGNKWAEKIIEGNPTSVGIRYQLAAIYAENNLMDKAIEQYNETIKLAKSDEQRKLFRFELARFYIKYKKFDMAEEIIKEIEKTFTTHDEKMRFYEIVYETYMLNYEKERAIKWAEKIIELDPEDIEHYLFVAGKYASMRLVDEGISQLERGLKFAKSTEEKDNYMKYIAAFCIKYKNYPKARTWLKKTIREAKTESIKSWAEQELEKLPKK